MARLLSRTVLLSSVRQRLRQYPAVLLIGPRQCGKTTLAHQVAATSKSFYFDLEDPATALRPEAAKQVLEPLRGLVVVDEFQRQPKLFELVRVLADRRPLRARFLLLGSASPDLVRGASETLAGRVAYQEMSGFDLAEVDRREAAKLWIRGGFPRSFLAPSDRESLGWRLNFVQSFLERDLHELGVRVPSLALRRFWTMLAHYHGQCWNAAEFARALGTGEHAVRHYLDLLAGAFMVRELLPWFENVGKRLVKSPKVYLRDSGLLHALLGLGNRLQVLGHPKLGASWEGFVIEQAIRLLGAERDAYFYRTQAGAELDLFVIRNGRRYGFEVKYEDAPRVTKSMHVALADLKLERLFIVYPGDQSVPVTERIDCVPLGDLPETIRRHRLGPR